ncbi:hypothetical protein RUM43_010729 [Polyplax serrata]|uniref:Uncharacterized protein n=1 Tax=Polyplax serrata TaxID=468196 RepID=A0AAN8PB00_POLSC
MARERERRRAGKLDDHGALNLVRFSTIKLGMFPASGRTTAVSLCSERAMSRGFPSLELDTVFEEKSDPDPEDTSDVLNALES